VYTVSVTTKHRGSECSTCVQNDVSEIVVIVTLFETYIDQFVSMSRDGFFLNFKHCNG